MTAPAKLCGRPILARDGKPLAEPCNLAPLHLGKCVCVAWELVGGARPAEHPGEGGAE